MIECFTDPEAALLRAGEKDFDVVISDYRMPGLNGADVFSLLKKIQPGAARIVLSGSAERAAVRDAIHRGEIYRYLTKPWDCRELVDVVVAAFACRHGGDYRSALSRQELEVLRLEQEEPGITFVERDEQGNILL